VATAVAVWLTGDDTFRPTVTSRLMAEVRAAGSFKDAEAAVLRIEQMDRLSAPLLDELSRAYLGNNQVYPRHVGARVVERIFVKHGRSLPKPGEYEDA
jgi:hypothetical protein